jgi:catechol 2,3-dioxygenase-like lactoylglutathione lyase family enzyme
MGPRSDTGVKTVKKRIGEPWIPAAEYGQSLPTFAVNLIVREIERSVAFYRSVLAADVHYADPDFAAIRVAGADVMLHADHAYEANPWAPQLTSNARRGLGAELRLLGLDPDDVATRARIADAVFKDVSVRGHGWREAMVVDPDGYVWAVGKLIQP